MTDSNRPADLREIGHLFLSSLRQKQTGNAPRPTRVPPQQRAGHSVDLSPEELRQVSGQAGGSALEPAAPPGLLRISAVLGGHRGHRSQASVRQLASQWCRREGRVGLIEVEADEIRVIVFEHHPGATAPAADNTKMRAAEMPGPLNARAMQQALDELSWDVGRWLVALPGPRAPESRRLLRDVKHLIVLGAADAEGVVGAYRTIKGCADVLKRENIAPPRLSLAVFEAADNAQAQSAHARLSSACRQFLNWRIEFAGRVGVAEPASEHLVLHCRRSPEKDDWASAWGVLAGFLRRSAEMDWAMPEAAETPVPTPPEFEDEAQAASPLKLPEQGGNHATPEPGRSMAGVFLSGVAGDEVIELPAGADDPASILTAVLSAGPGRWTDTGIIPPMCSDARLAVSRDRNLTLLGVVGQGLAGLRAVAQAYEWMCQNRNLIAMALPQFAIAAHAMPRLILLVDHTELATEQFRTILSATQVSILAYRRLRWSGKTGLLLEAA